MSSRHSRKTQKIVDQMFGTTWKKWICLIVGHSYGKAWYGDAYAVYPCLRCRRKIAKVEPV